MSLRGGSGGAASALILALAALTGCDAQASSPVPSVAVPTSLVTVAPSATAVADRTPLSTELVALVAPAGWAHTVTEPGQIGLHHAQFDITVLVAAALQQAPTGLADAVAAHRDTTLAAVGGEVCAERETQSVLPVPGQVTFICHPDPGAPSESLVTSQLVGVSADGMIVYTVLIQAGEPTAAEAFDLVEVAIFPTVRWTYTSDPRIGTAP